MPHIEPSALQVTPFVLLLVAVLGLWIHRYVWIASLLASVVVAYFTGALHGWAAFWMLWISCAAYDAPLRDPERVPPFPLWRRACSLLTFSVLALALALNYLPGFPRTTLVADIALTPDARPYGIGLGFPKVFVGLLVLGVINPALCRSCAELGRVLWKALPVFVVTVVVVMGVTLSVGFVRFEPKWLPLFVVWAPVNLFFTCMAEEAFFRGLVQDRLARILADKKLGAGVAIAVASILFGASHYAGGLFYVIVATLAGVGYGVAYHRTGRIEAAMAVHFGVNALHFLLFTYPRLT